MGEPSFLVHKPTAHDSAAMQVAGRAPYVDDLPEPPGLLHLAFGLSTIAHGAITGIDLAAVRAAPGVVAVYTAQDIPGTNDVSPFAGDDPMLAKNEVLFFGQPIFLVAATSARAARRAAKLGRVSYEPRPAILTIEEALARQSFIEPSQIMGHGDVEAALSNAPHRVTGRLEMGGQDHFYLEGQVALAIPGEDGTIHLHASSQHPSEVQHLVAHLLHRNSADVVVEVRRMGGGFGGKETQPALFAAAAALVAHHTGRPAKFRADRDDDMEITGKRHDFHVTYDVGFDAQGRILGLRLELASRCGWSTDLSPAINDRAMFHADNCYFLPAVEIISHRCRTNTVSNTAFRGFGGPQGMLAIERIIDHVASETGCDALAVRRANFYDTPGMDSGRRTTPYGMAVEDFVAPEIMAELEESSLYQQRVAAVEAFNAVNTVLKKGIAMTPVKFGISFTTTHLNQAGALVLVYADGSVSLNHGGTEMGQGLNIKVAQVVADVFGIPLSQIRITATRTDKVPNTSATAASSGSDLNGMAAYHAAIQIRDRLAHMLGERHGVAAELVRFTPDGVVAGETVIPFAQVTKQAYLARVQLSASGFYATPDIAYDRTAHKGRPFYYFAYGAAVSEVVIDTLTGEHRVLSADILHDAGRSLNPAIDLGQVEGAYVQGMGWLTTEELVWNEKGRLTTHAPSTYKIPTANDRPARMEMRLWQQGRAHVPTIHRSKAVGEPPFMLAISVFSALTQAVMAAAPGKGFPALNAPATPERVLAAIAELRGRHG
ncbi:MAG: xanthine dehydrogenase molybdopterin binding subunit [Sphingomonadales bacterium]|nr:xanthine dehydrogenase molybdopterin binding subunit [Sphingomonadales bacterium]MDE2168124.1 xanthine dehydrogenase molybdopterin binding subunit [Sphingomonadales bacterium]